MRPLAPKSVTVSSSGPLLEQSVGMVVYAGSPMIWMGMFDATSPAILTSARRTEPQVKPSSNCMHSTSAAPLLAFFGGSESPLLSTDETMRSPLDPVSTLTWSMVWQLLVFGTQMVTLTKGTSTEPAPPGP